MALPIGQRTLRLMSCSGLAHEAQQLPLGHQFHSLLDKQGKKFPLGSSCRQSCCGQRHYACRALPLSGLMTSCVVTSCGVSH